MKGHKICFYGKLSINYPCHPLLSRALKIPPIVPNWDKANISFVVINNQMRMSDIIFQGDRQTGKMCDRNEWTDDDNKESRCPCK